METGSGVTQAAREGLVPLTRLHEAFPGGTPRLQARNAQRWCSTLSPALKEKHGRSWEVSLEARLPDHRTVESLVKVGAAPAKLAGFRLPDGHEKWADRDRQRFLDTHELLKRFDELRATYPKLSEKKVVVLFEQQNGQWAKEQGLSCNLRTIRDYRRRVRSTSDSFDGNSDRRGRKRQTEGQRDERCSPEAWELFKQIYLHQNKHTVAAAWRFVKAKARKEGWAWPSESTIRLRVNREMSQAILTYHREGKRAFEAGCVPKLAGNYEALPAGDWWCLDGRTLDFVVRVPDSRGEWRRERAVLTAVMDVRSRMFVGWDLSMSEHTDGILRGIKMALGEFGVPLRMTIDNGKAYKSAVKNGVRRQRCVQREIMDNLCRRLDIRVCSTLPYHAWSKQIESIWNKVKNGFDRWWPSFCGGSPKERPASAAPGQRIEDLPTLDEARIAFRTYLDTYHASPQSGSGTRGLSPRQVMAQYRGEYRPIDEAVLLFLVTRVVGPRTVKRDGIHLNNLVYGRLNPDVAVLQGKKVLIRIDPKLADSVIVCDLNGVPLCHATSDRLLGVTQEQIRKASKLRARVSRQAKQYKANRDVLEQTPTDLILAIQQEEAKILERERDATLPPPPTPATVRILHPEFLESIEKLGTPEDAAVNDLWELAIAEEPQTSAVANDHEQAEEDTQQGAALDEYNRHVQAHESEAALTRAQEDEDEDGSVDDHGDTGSWAIGRQEQAGRESA